MLFLLLLTILSSSSYSSSLQFTSSNNNNNKSLIDTVINLSNYNLNNVNNLLIYKNKYIIIGGENFLLKLSTKSFEVKELIRYGPIFDSRQCKFYPNEECSSFNSEKYLTNNYNKLLIVLKQQQQQQQQRDEDDGDSLISCWTSYQGICDMRSMSNLNNLIVNSTIPSVANDIFNSTVGFITLSPSLQQILLVATTYNNNGAYRDDIPAIAGRSLLPQQKLHFMQILTNNNQGLKESKSSIEFMSRQLKTFIVKYIDGFKTKYYNYFLSIQPGDVGQVIQTKIIRFCQNDLSFIKSYIEQPLRCESSDGLIFYNELVHSRLIEWSPNGDDKKKASYLVGLFQETKRYTMQNISDLSSSKPLRQAICVYKLSEINKRFVQNFKTCLTSNTGVLMRGLSFIKPDQVCRSYAFNSFTQTDNNDLESDNESNDNFCSLIESNNMNLYPIGGQLAATTDLIYELNEPNILFNHLNFKFLSTTRQAMLVLLSNSNNLLKFYKLNVDKNENLKFISEVELNTQSSLTTRPLIIDRLLTNLEFSVDKSKLFVINKNYFYQVSASNEALLEKEDQKSSGSSVVISIEPTLITNINKQKWIEIQMRNEIKTKYKCQYGTDTVTDAIPIDFSRLKCSLPHQTQIDQMKFHSYDFNQSLLFRNEIANGRYEIKFSLSTTNKSIVFEQPIRFINCNAHKSCLSCMQNHDYCRWSSIKCLMKNDSQGVDDGDDDASVCASFNVGSTSKLLIPFTTSSRQQAPLTIELLKFNSNANFVCMITFIRSLNLYQNFTVKVKILNETHVQCILDELFHLNDLFKSANGKLETNFRLYDTSLDYFIDSNVLNIEFIFYKCEILASNCAECSQIKSFYSCGWCSNSFSKQECKFIPVNVNRIPILKKLFIDTQKCKLFNDTEGVSSSCSASIDDTIVEMPTVKPNKVPLSGGTLITLNGVKSGDLCSNVTICGQKCEIKEAFSNQIKCITKASAFEQECFIVLSYLNANSENFAQKLEFVEVKIDSIKPNELIQSCKGCIVEINGKNLDVGLNRRLRVLDSSSMRTEQQPQQVDYTEEVSCDIQLLTKEKLKCSLNTNFNYLGKKNIVYEIDKQTNILNYQSLRVSSNPLIISINKRETIIQGGTRFELQGYNFNLIQRIQVFIEYHQQYFVQNVFKRLSNERLVFKFPNLSQFNTQNSLTANIGFLMDNYNQTLDQIQINFFKIDQTPLFEINSLSLLDNGLDEYVLLIKFESNNELQTKFKPDLDIFILNDNLSHCYCDFKLWLNETYLTCKFNKQNCESHQFVSEISSLANKPIENFMDLIKVSIGNYEIKQANYAGIQYESSEILNGYLKQVQIKQQNLIPQATQFNVNRIILIITSIVLAILVLILLSILVYYYKKKFSKLRQRNKLKLIKLNDSCDAEKMSKLLNKICYLETNLNNKCKNEYEKIKIEFLNEFNLNLIYNGIPIYSYKQYLINFLNLNPGFILSSSNGNACSNSINGYETNGGGGSVFYATIKSTDTLMHTPSPLLLAPQKNYSKNQIDAMTLFNQLINNKIFLGIFMHVLNKQENFINQDRQQFTSLLQLLLKTNLPYLYSIIKLQLSDLIASKPLTAVSTISTTLTTTSSKGPAQTSILDYLLTNWISIFMYQYINDNLSIKLYRLIKLLKYQLESGPIDLSLNLAKYCLNENYLLKFDDNSYKKLYVNLINQQQVYKTYFLLDCDCIRQCKEKFLDYLYKNIANSQRPLATDIELEFYLAKNQQQLSDILFVDTSSITKVLLKEYDDNESCLDFNGNKYKRLLCVKDYGITDGAYISIQYKQTSMMINRIMTTANNYQTMLVENNKHFSMKGSSKFIKNYHLIKPNDAISSSCSSSASSSSSTSPLAGIRKSLNNRKTNISDDDNVKLTRLLLIKGTLQPFIDDLFETLFTNTANLSPIIKHLFDYFDVEFRKIHGETSSDSSMRIWKTNIYFLKFWLNILKNPQLVFDINKTVLIDASLQSILQVFIDCCSEISSLEHVTTNHLIFSNDIRRYKSLIDHFYNEIESYPHISDHELHYYLNEFSKCQTNDSNSIDILLNLYEYYEKYEKGINEMLGQQQCSVLLPLHHKLVQIKDLMISQHQQDQENIIVSDSNRTTPIPTSSYNNSFLIDSTTKLTTPMNHLV